METACLAQKFLQNSGTCLFFLLRNEKSGSNNKLLRSQISFCQLSFFQLVAEEVVFCHPFCQIKFCHFVIERLHFYHPFLIFWITFWSSLLLNLQNWADHYKFEGLVPLSKNFNADMRFSTRSHLKTFQNCQQIGWVWALNLIIDIY